MSSQIVALSGLPNQTISITLALNGSTLSLGLKQYYNRIAGFWVLDIFDASGVLLIGSVPLITGDWPAGNILSPYEYMKIGQAFCINQNGANTDYPVVSNLGSGFALLWADNIGSGFAPGFPTVPEVSASGEWSSYNVAGLTTVLG